MDKEKSRIISLLSVLALVGVTFAVYLNTLKGGFVYDDNLQIEINPWIKSAVHLRDIFFTHSFGFMQDFKAMTYRPMVFVVYMLEYRFFGLEPWGWHLVNVILHAVNTILVYLVVYSLLPPVNTAQASTLSRWTGHLPPFASALIFSIHPVKSEAVAWLACLPELFFTLLCLSGLYIHIRGNAAIKSRSVGFPARIAYYLLPAVLFFIAVFFKETAAALPLLVFLYDFLIDRDKGFFSVDKLFKYTPYVIAVVLYLPMRANALEFIPPTEQYNAYLGLTRYQFMLNIFPLFVQYLAMLVLPLYDYPMRLFDPVFTLSAPKAFLSLLATAAISALVVVLRKTLFPRYLFAIAFVVIPILPTFYAIWTNQAPYTDRYLYFPSVGAAIFLALIVRRVVERPWAQDMRRVAVAVIVLGLYAAVFSVWTAGKNRIWKDNLTFWGAALDGASDNHVASYNIGKIYLKEGKTDEAIKILKASIKANMSKATPDPSIQMHVYRQLAVAYSRKEMVDEAIDAFGNYLALKPDDITAVYNLAALYRKKGLYGDAVEQYTIALLLAREPWQFKDIYLNLGESYIEAGNGGKALESYRKALQYAPGDPEITGNIMRILAK